MSRARMTDAEFGKKFLELNALLHVHAHGLAVARPEDVGSISRELLREVVWDVLDAPIRFSDCMVAEFKPENQR